MVAYELGTQRRDAWVNQHGSGSVGVVLPNKDKVTGTIVSADDQCLEVKVSANGPTVLVFWSAIAYLRATPPPQKARRVNVRYG